MSKQKVGFEIMSDFSEMDVRVVDETQNGSQDEKEPLENASNISSSKTAPDIVEIKRVGTDVDDLRSKVAKEVEPIEEVKDEDEEPDLVADEDAAVGSEDMSLLKLVVLLLSIVSLLIFYVQIGAMVMHFLESTGEVMIPGPREKRGDIADEIFKYINKTYCSNFNQFMGGKNVSSVMSQATDMLLKGNIQKVMKNYETLIIKRKDEGWQPGHEVTLKQDFWSFSKAVLFVTALITTVGYGDVAPTTWLGRIFTILYSLIGIPMCLISLTTIGMLLAKFMRFIMIFICKKDKDPNTGRVKVPLKVSLLIMFLYLALGAFLFSLLTNGRWNYIECFYFCYITLTTIGLGDFVYGGGEVYTEISFADMALTTVAPIVNSSAGDSSAGDINLDQRNAIGSVVYVMFGLSLVSMCFTLMQDQIVYISKKAMLRFKAKVAKMFKCSKKEKVPKE